MNTLHAKQSGLHMRRALVPLTRLVPVGVVCTATTGIPLAQQQLAATFVPPVCSFFGSRLSGTVAALSRMSSDSPVTKKARLDPVAAAAAAAPPAPDTAAADAATATTAAADATDSPKAGSRRRIRRSRSPITNGTAAVADVPAVSEANGKQAAVPAHKPQAAPMDLESAATAVGHPAAMKSSPKVLQQQQQQLAQQQRGSPVRTAQAYTSPGAAGMKRAYSGQADVPQRAADQQEQQRSPQQQQSPRQQQQQQQLSRQQQSSRQQQQEAGKQSQQQQQQPQQQQQGQQSRKKKKTPSPVFQLVTGIHKCIKMDMPHEAFYLYQKIKTVDPSHKMDTSTVSALLNLVVGKWRWELQQRCQHLIRQYKAEGMDTAPLEAAFDACVAAVIHEKQQQSKETGDQYAKVYGAHPSDAPEAMMCHIERQIELLDDSKASPEQVAGLLEGMPEERIPLQELLDQAVSVSLADLEANGQTWDELIYLQLARVAGIMGDTDKAYDYAKRLVSAWESSNKSPKLAPRLRDFQPALVGYALTGQADKATEIVDIMTNKCGLEMTESEYGLWFEAIANGGMYDQMASALQATATELNELRETTVAMVERFFRSDRAKAAEPVSKLKKQQWQQQWVTPDDQGHIQQAGVQLQLADLSAEDWKAFEEQVASLGIQQEKKQGRFQEYMKWVKRNGPYDIMIDGANVALWGENYEQGSFKPEKMKVMYETVAKDNPNARILLVLHAGRYATIKKDNGEMFEWLEELLSKKNFIIAPGGSNDDWYWMYAAVVARERGMLVSNDLLRDHVWNLLRPKHMLKWTQRHIIRYYFNFPKTEAYLQYPLPYTPCVQYNKEKGVWMVPCVDREGQWLCVQAV